MNYANQLDQSNEPCSAAQDYADAQALQPDPKVAESLRAAEASCAKTPKPPAHSSGTPGTPEATAAVKLTPTP